MDLPLTYYEIDRAAIAHNLHAVRRHIGESVLLMPIVKANAYGHGAVEVAKTVLQVGADRLGVNRVPEGVELRQAGINAPILIMGYVLPSDMATILEHGLTPTITEWEGAQVLSALAPHPIKIHIKVDTGMGRLGLLPEETIPFIQAVRALPNLEIEGLYTHFSVADSPEPDDQAYTQKQLAIFKHLLADLEAQEIQIPLPHAANSAGTLYYPEAHLGMIRLGIALYGLRPDANNAPPFELKPALSLKSHVARLRILPSGSSLSYGRTYTTNQPAQIALIPVGYGDGYPRILSNRGAVLIQGQRAPIVGRVCMDQFMVDVTHISGVNLHDEVVLIGQQGGAVITADEVAQWAQTINYEVTTSLLNRAPRLYKNQP